MVDARAPVDVVGVELLGCHLDPAQRDHQRAGDAAAYPNHAAGEAVCDASQPEKNRRKICDFP